MLEFLNSFTNFESRLHQISPQAFQLDRISKLLDLLGNPQKDLRVIHVAGTKGKGSTCAMTASILRAAGFTVGLYTSPHFYNVNERIRILNPNQRTQASDFEGQISNEKFFSLIAKIKPAINALGKNQLTYFEVLTALAFCHFAKEKVDFAVLETGLGGRLDATNVVDALVSVITPISFDHTALLGNTLAKIAKEKAAIIKNKNGAVVVGQQSKEAMDVILKRCRGFSIEPLCVGKDVTYRMRVQDFNGQKIIVSFPRKRESRLDPRWSLPPLDSHFRGNDSGGGGDILEVKTTLLGAHQAQNVATAFGVIECLRRLDFKISDQAMRRGIQETRWPGRFEVLGKKPLVIADGAHNVASAHALVKTVKKVLPQRKVILILGVSEDKDIQGICRVLNYVTDYVIATHSQHPRAHRFNTNEMLKLFPKKEFQITSNIGEALRTALTTIKRNDAIIVAGSLFIAAEAKKEYVSI